MPLNFLASSILSFAILFEDKFSLKYKYKIAKILRLKESSVRTIKSRAIKEINKTLNNEGNKKNE